MRCGFGIKHRSVYLRRMSPLDHCTVTYSLKNCCYQAHFMAVMRDKLPYFHLTLIERSETHETGVYLGMLSPQLSSALLSSLRSVLGTFTHTLGCFPFVYPPYHE